MAIKYTRKQYMDGDVSHDDYYGQFATPDVVAMVAGSIGRGRIMRSTDPHFNDIPLRKWDRLHDSVRTLVGDLVCDANESTHAGERSLSLSDTVCVAKAAARKIRETVEA